MIKYKKHGQFGSEPYMKDIFEQTDASVLHLRNWENVDPALVVGLTTRSGGHSEPPYNSLNIGLHVGDQYETIIKNRETLAEKLSVPLTHWVTGEQVHGTAIHVVQTNDKGKGAYDFDTSIKNVDGLITKEKGLLCSAYFADCVPLYFYDSTTGYIGMAHAGWKGTVNGIAKKMVEKMHGLGADLTDLLVAVGPSISQSNYEVDQHVIDHIDVKYKDAVTTASKQPGKYLLDLKQLNRAILRDSGLRDENIKISNYCTYREKDLFFSHRRDQGKTGRMLGFIGYRR